MKRVSLGVALSLLIGVMTVGPLEAQGWNGGVSLGGTYSNASGSVVNQSDYRWGGSIGAFIGYMARSWMARVEGNFVGRGGDRVVTAQNTSLNYSFQYIEIPLLVGPVLSLGDAWKWEFFTGFTPGFQTSCKVTVGTSGTGSTDCEPGLPGGAGESPGYWIPLGTSLDYKLPASKTTFIFDFRYNFALSSSLTASSLKSSNFQFLIRMMFGG